MSHASTTTATPAATTYGFHCDIDDKDFGSAVARVTEAMKTEGFGVLTEIDVGSAHGLLQRRLASGELAPEEYEKRKTLLDRNGGAKT